MLLRPCISLICFMPSRPCRPEYMPARAKNVSMTSSSWCAVSTDSKPPACRLRERLGSLGQLGQVGR